MIEQIFIPRGNRRLVRTVWGNVTRPIGIVQIVRDSTTTHTHQDAFARYMNKHGYIVSACPIDGAMAAAFDAQVDDEVAVMDFLCRKYDLPLFLFGQSYGGFVAQSIMNRAGTHAAGACMAGTPHRPDWIVGTVRIVAWLGRHLWGTNARARILDFMCAPHGTRHTYGYYDSLFKNLVALQHIDTCARPMLIIGGARDLAGIGGCMARLVGGTHPRIGSENLTLIIYPDAGRDMLVNMNYENLRSDVLQFCNAATRQ